MTREANKPDIYAQVRHDLRTPLNQIIGYSELLLEDAQEQGHASLMPDLQKIRTAAAKLLQLIESYLGPPRHDDEPVPDATASDETPAILPQQHQLVESARLLVVDDSETNRDMLSRRLIRSGYKVETAGDGDEALRKTEAGKFDLILLDIMMPGISGLDVLKVLRQTFSAGDLPVIMATAMNASSDIVEALRLGANDYVTKPIDFPVVLARVESQLSLKRARDQVRKLAEELELRNRFIQHLFGRYLSQKVVSNLLESPQSLKLGGESRTVTILLSDIRGFASLSARLSPEQVVRLLNTYLGFMADIIMKYHGTIDEFIGDSILAVFGAPLYGDDDALRAVACAIEMQRAMEAVNHQNETEGLPRIAMGIGLHTGEVIVGNIGSEDRMKFGIVGPPVNLASRIESCTVAGQVLISEATLDGLRGEAQVGEHLSIHVKGFQNPITVYEIQGVRGRFNVFLEWKEEPMVSLKEGIRIQYAVLEEKTVADETFSATLVRVSTMAAEILAGATLLPLKNIQIYLFADDGSAIPGVVYAKVAHKPAETPGAFLVHFTSLSPEAEAFLRTTGLRS